MKLLENQVTLITGATRGIGKGIARKFAEQGSSVAFTYVSSEEKALTLCKELKEMGVNAKGYKSNAGKFNEAQDLIDQILTWKNRNCNIYIPLVEYEKMEFK